MHTKLYHLAKAVSNHWTTGKIDLFRPCKNGKKYIPLRPRSAPQIKFASILTHFETYAYNLY